MWEREIVPLIKIFPLNFSLHREILSSLSQFWGEKGEKLIPYHSWIYPAFFSFYSLVACYRGKIIGYMYGLGVPEKKRGFIHHLAVLPPFYQKGVASSLLKEFLKRAKKKNLHFLYAYIHPKGGPIVSFLKKHGFSFLMEVEIAPQERRYLYIRREKAGIVDKTL